MPTILQTVTTMSEGKTSKSYKPMFVEVVRGNVSREISSVSRQLLCELEVGCETLRPRTKSLWSVHRFAPMPDGILAEATEDVF